VIDGKRHTINSDWGVDKMLKNKFNVIKNSRGYVIVRVDGTYEQHAHIKTMDVCRLLIRLIEANKLPTSRYLQGSCRRLLLEEEYSQLKRKKQYYINVNKGCRA
jgi:hypothetical protein